MKLGVQVGLGPSHIVLDGDPAPLAQRGTAPPPIFGPYPLRPNGCIDRDTTWYGGRPRPRRLCVRWEPRSPLPKKGEGAPKFLSHVYCGQTDGWIKMVSWHGDRPQTRRLCVKWGPSPPPKFSAHVYYSYCDFLRTLHKAQSLLVCSSFSILCILFLEKKV